MKAAAFLPDLPSARYVYNIFQRTMTSGRVTRISLGKSDNVVKAREAKTLGWTESALPKALQEK